MLIGERRYRIVDGANRLGYLVLPEERFQVPSRRRGLTKSGLLRLSAEHQQAFVTEWFESRFFISARPPSYLSYRSPRPNVTPLLRSPGPGLKASRIKAKAVRDRSAVAVSKILNETFSFLPALVIEDSIKKLAYQGEWSPKPDDIQGAIDDAVNALAALRQSLAAPVVCSAGGCCGWTKTNRETA